MLEKKKVAVVYDWFDKWGGVERVLLVFKEMFPNAVFFTSYNNIEKTPWSRGFNLKTSFINKLPSIIKNRRILSLPFYEFAFETFNFNKYDLVISVTSSFAKSVITQPGTRHICYLLTPTRFLWSHKDIYLKNYLKYLAGYLNFLSYWDKIIAQRPDKIVSISETVKNRCKKYYQRESEVIYPPFDIDYWNKIKQKIKNDSQIENKKNKNYFLVVSRLEKYKKIDLIIKTFNKLGDQLIIIGQGSQENFLKKIAKENIQFYSNISDRELAVYYSNAEALIMPQEEDFGYVSLEAQFFNCPVISYIKGGGRETVVKAKTGIFFTNQTEESLSEAIERFKRIRYNLRLDIVNSALDNINRFSKEKFINSFKNIL